MNREKLIDLMDCMIEAEWNVEAMKEISLLLMDAFRKQDVAVSGKLFYCYYSLLGQAEKQMDKSLEMLNGIMTGTKEQE